MREGEIGSCASEDSSSFKTNRIRELTTFEIAVSKVDFKNDAALADESILKYLS